MLSSSPPIQVVLGQLLYLECDAMLVLRKKWLRILGAKFKKFARYLSNPEADRNHPYGHQKFEAIGALGIAAPVIWRG